MKNNNTLKLRGQELLDLLFNGTLSTNEINKIVKVKRKDILEALSEYGFYINNYKAASATKLGDLMIESLTTNNVLWYLFSEEISEKTKQKIEKCKAKEIDIALETFNLKPEYLQITKSSKLQEKIINHITKKNILAFLLFPELDNNLKQKIEERKKAELLLALRNTKILPSYFSKTQSNTLKDLMICFISKDNIIDFLTNNELDDKIKLKIYAKRNKDINESLQAGNYSVDNLINSDFNNIQEQIINNLDECNILEILFDKKLPLNLKYKIETSKKDIILTAIKKNNFSIAELLNNDDYKETIINSLTAVNIENIIFSNAFDEKIKNEVIINRKNEVNKIIAKHLNDEMLINYLLDKYPPSLNQQILLVITSINPSMTKDNIIDLIAEKTIIRYIQNNRDNEIIKLIQYKLKLDYTTSKQLVDLIQNFEGDQIEYFNQIPLLETAISVDKYEYTPILQRNYNTSNDDDTYNYNSKELVSFDNKKVYSLVKNT